MKKSTKKTLRIYYDTGGTCYSRVGFPKTDQGKKDAKLLSKAIKKDGGDYANGGMLDGIPMGGLHEYKDHIEVYVNFYYYHSEFNIIEDDTEWRKICESRNIRRKPFNR